MSRYIHPLLILLFATLLASCRREDGDKENPNPPRSKMIDSVKTLSDYVHNLQEIGGYFDHPTPPRIPELEPISKLDSLIKNALEVDTTELNFVGIVGTPATEMKGIVRVAGTTEYLDLTLSIDTATALPVGGVALKGNGKVLGALTWESWRNGTKAKAYIFHLQDTWQFDQKMFGANVVLFGNVVGKQFSCYAMIYTDYFTFY